MMNHQQISKVAKAVFVEVRCLRLASDAMLYYVLNISIMMKNVIATVLIPKTHILRAFKLMGMIK